MKTYDSQFNCINDIYLKKQRHKKKTICNNLEKNCVISPKTPFPWQLVPASVQPQVYILSIPKKPQMKMMILQGRKYIKMLHTDYNSCI